MMGIISTFREEVKETGGISTPREERGDPLIGNIWKDQTDCIMNVRITNLDAPSIITNLDALVVSFEKAKLSH